ncbi:MAG: MerR family transcriptional regulator [Bacteroidetes bacterium]|nr:MAG: MerR family transcriptional regulator [Bacteroidota bacterium]
MSHYSIKDLENLTGIKAHTIRMWEQRYNLITPERTDTNIRTYGSEDLKLMLNVSLLNNHGYKISKIAKMSSNEVCNCVMETIEKRSSFEDQIGALTIAMLDLNEQYFDQIMSKNITEFGFEQTMIKIIYPFFSRVGTLWIANAVNPAQEHFISNLIRQKVIQAISSTDCLSKNARKFLLFLPEGELHELSLLFAYYLIKSRGHQVFYLGQNMPMHDLYSVYETHKADYLFAIITTTPSQDQIQNYVDKLADLIPNAKILLTGRQVVGQDIQTKDNTTVITDISILINLIEELAESNRS